MMKVRKLIPSLMIVLVSAAGCRDDIAASFADPDDSYGIDVWWLWHNSYVSKDAITAELSAMKDKHFHGFTIYDTGGHDQRGNHSLPCGPKFGSDRWNDLMLHSLRVADSLGLKASLVIQSGWNLGGPMVPPEQMAKHVVASQIEVHGGQRVSVSLPEPEAKFDWYRDIAVLAFPLNDKTASGMTDLRYKTCDRELGMSTPDSRFLLFNEKSDEKTWVAPVDSILDLSGNMDADGNLEWDAPAGCWAVIRAGYAPTGSKVSTSSDNWGGYSLDHLHHKPLEDYWNMVVEPVLDVAQDYVSTTLQTVETDSWEAGGMNWTDDFREYFKEYCGYDMVKYLPVVLGYVIDDETVTSSFLADWRKTIADMVAERHYGRLAELAHSNGLLTMPESAGPHAGPFDGIRNYGFNDVLMSEFWSPSPHRPLHKNRFFVKQASSAAHIYGKRIVNAEAFTTIGRTWDITFWKDQKPAFDHEICSGMNRICIHSFASSPTEMGVPGAQSFAGSYFDSRNTWWEYAAPVFDYFRRVQYVVQNGQFKADVLYYYGDQVPNVYPLKEADMAHAMPGFDYDVTDENILLELCVEKGEICTPSGMEYRVLVLPDHQTLSLEALRKVERLVSDGAVVLSRKPLHLITLKGGSAAQEEFRELSDKIWGTEDLPSGNVSYGKGKVVWGVTSREYLLSSGLIQDFAVAEDEDLSDFDYIHYEIDGKDFYFVSNQSSDQKDVTLVFRSTGRTVQLWDPVTGTISNIVRFSSDGKSTTVPISLDPYGSAFVVFGEKNRDYAPYAQTFTVAGGEKDIIEIDGRWSLGFDKAYDGPQYPVTYDELTDLSLSEDINVRHYSGPVRYETSFEVSRNEGSTYELYLSDTGHVGLADVKLNGEPLGWSWTAPYRYDVTDALKDGTNEITVTIVNSWYNRVAGEEMYPDMKRITNTNIVLSHDYKGNPTADIPMPVSGLIGPVFIKEIK